MNCLNHESSRIVTNETCVAAGVWPRVPVVPIDPFFVEIREDSWFGLVQPGLEYTSPARTFVPERSYL
jgi:hypothetical protein